MRDAELRKALDEAQSIIYMVELVQTMAFASDNGIDKKFGIVDYVALLNEFLPRLQKALSEAEKASFINQ